MFSSNFLCTDKTPRFPSTREVGLRYLTIIVFRLSTLLRLFSLKRTRTKKKDLSIDDASWREETMIGWVVRLDGSGGWIARLGFHPTPSFSTPSPATRVVPRPRRTGLRFRHRPRTPAYETTNTSRSNFARGRLTLDIQRLRDLPM